MQNYRAKCSQNNIKIERNTAQHEYDSIAMSRAGYFMQIKMVKYAKKYSQKLSQICKKICKKEDIWVNKEDVELIYCTEPHRLHCIDDGKIVLEP